MLTPFQPLPLLASPHAQTVLSMLIPGPACPPPRRHVVPLSDGDSIFLYENTPRRPSGAVALVVHGLTGSHRSRHIVRIASRLLRRGVHVYRLDLRGAGDGVSLARQTYHAGRWQDLRDALAFIRARHPAAPLWMVALSLGGNMALHLAANGADLARLVALNPPIDLERCARMVALPGNRFYERRFVRDLLTNVTERHRHFPDLPRAKLWAEMTLRRFDDLYTAPRNGFRDSDHYYAEASSMSFLHKIRTPTLLMTSRDDPFIDPAPFDEVQLPSCVEFRMEQKGGHIGYLGSDGAGGIHWAERFVVEWLHRP